SASSSTTTSAPWSRRCSRSPASSGSQRPQRPKNWLKRPPAQAMLARNHVAQRKPRPAPRLAASSTERISPDATKHASHDDHGSHGQTEDHRTTDEILVRMHAVVAAVWGRGTNHGTRHLVDASRGAQHTP